MAKRKWAVALIVGFVGGVVAVKVLSRPRIVRVEIPIPEHDIPFSGSSMREIHRDPQRYGRRNIFLMLSAARVGGCWEQN